MPHRLGAATVTLLYAALAGLWILASATLLHVVIDDASLQSRIEIAKGLAFVALTSLLLYALLRRWTGGALPEAAGEADASGFTLGWRLVLVLALLALSVPLVGFMVFSLQARDNEQRAFSELRVIADYKAAQIERWLAERRGDAMSLAASAGFIERVERFRRDADPREAALIRNRLQSMLSAYRYDAIALLDPAGRPLLSVGDAAPMDAALHADMLRQAMASDGVWMSALHADDAGDIHLHLVTVLKGPGGDQPLAIADLRVSAADFLFPLMESWPTASASGETFLVRADGDDVLYLNALRHRGSEGTAKRMPLDTARLPAAEALRGRFPGQMQGVNYRGVPVLSAWAPVAGADWELVANLDRDEVLAPAWMTALWISAIAVIAAAMVAVALLLLLREQRRAQQLALQARSDALLRHFYELPFIGMAITSPTTKRWLRFNDRLCEMFGYAPAELARMSWPEMTHPDDLPRNLAEFERVLGGQSEGYRLEKRFIRKDGSTILTSMDVKCVRKPGGEVDYLVTTVEDITERKAAERRIVDLSRLYQTLSRCNAAIVHSKDENALLGEVCRATVESGGMVLAWVGMVDADARRVRVAASAAATPSHLEYLEGIEVSVDADDPRGRGPTGTAIREGAPFWCQDFLTDPRTAPWHERAARHGWRASAALPLRRRGRTAGALTLYMSEANAFDEETRRLLAEIADDVSFGMDSFDREAARKAAERELRASEERYRLLIQNSQDAILFTAPDGRIFAANPAASRIFGATEAEIVAGGRAAIVDAADPRLGAALAERERSGSFSGEITMRRSSGERFPAELSTSVFTGSDGEPRTSMIIRDISERKRAEERLEYLARHDQLTDLPNRTLLTDRLAVALAQTQRTGKQLALLFVDLDRFKHVNDSMGHAVGDQLLREAAARLRSCVRSSDTVGRQGGDEFLVMLSDIENAQGAARVADKLIAAIGQPFTLDGAEVLLTASVGIACAPVDGNDAETLVRNADAAMFSAKDQGRNRYQFYTPEMNLRAHQRLALEHDLRRAVQLSQLFLVFQPQVRLESGALTGFEALVRWRHPTRGVVPPGEFIAIAEDSGLIAEIGAWVLDAACQQQASWVKAGLPAGTMAVNVSAHQFRQPGFVATVTQALERSGLDPLRLELELTESVIMRGAASMLQRLQDLDRLGVTLSIDDFGTGYSSLAYLNQFPIDRLKIDQSFVRGLPENRGSAAITQAVISLGHSLGLNVLAEGIETEAQAEFLRSLWCDAGQGYLYARPMPAAECTEYLRQKLASDAETKGE